MFESIYVGQTGLSTFSRNLTVIGNNISNLNTPGFKSSRLSFSELVYRNVVADGGQGSGAGFQLGSGVGSGGAQVLFTQGELRQTGSDTDLAISGNGFFVLRAGRATSYTRAGEFQFDSDGFLISRATGARVQAYDGGLHDIDLSALRTVPPRATAVVRLIDNLSTGGTTKDVPVTVFNAAGGSRALTLKFTNNSTVVPRSWLFDVRDETNALVAAGEVRFNGDGSPAAGFNSTTFTLNTPGVAPTQIVIDFGAAGQFSGATNFSAGTESSLRLGSQDGRSAGALVTVGFDADGVLMASYSNGETRKGERLALAFFESPERLELAGAGSFENRAGLRVTLGNPRTGALGAIAGRSLESANVDLAEEFGELIITQRGYQASSQIVTTANEMIQQLFDMRSRR